MMRLPTVLVTLTVLLFVSTVQADFSVLGSNGFAYCYVDAENLLRATCSDSEIVPGGDCTATCSVYGAGGEVSGRYLWEIEAESMSVVEGDFGQVVHAIVDGERISDEVFTVSVGCSWDYLLGEPGAPEIALIRFDGDPAVFDGTSAVRVSELVDLGLIDAADVLGSRVCWAVVPQFDFDVDVTGIPSEELVLFAGGRISPSSPIPPVPAVSPVGAVLLASLLLGLGALALKRVA
jgi:hypothetical protein